MRNYRSLTLATVQSIHAVHPAPSDAFFAEVDKTRGLTDRSNPNAPDDPAVIAFVASLPPGAFYAEAARLMAR